MSYFHNDPDRHKKTLGLLSLFIGFSILVAIGGLGDLLFNFMRAWYSLLH